MASTDPVFVGAGDIGSCAVTEDTDTGNIIAGIDGAIWTTGDNVYDNGTAAEFTNCYATTPWGSAPVKSRTRPIPGNHDWGLGITNNLDGYFGYFGAAANAGGTSYYSYDIAGSNWHIVNLDTECALVGGCNAGSPQETWLKADLAANAGKNVIAAVAQAAVQLGRHQPPDPAAAVGRPVRGRRRHPARWPRPHLRAVRADEVGRDAGQIRRSPTRPTASASSRSAPAARATTGWSPRCRPARSATTRPSAS